MGKFKQDNNYKVEIEEAVYLKDDERSNRTWFKIWPSVTDVILLLILASVIAIAVEFGYVSTIKQGFICGDPKISYLYRGDSISTVVLLFVSMLAPIFIIMAVEKIRCDGGASLRQRWLWYQGFLVGFSFFIVIVEILKVLAGEPRPHFLHTCAPDSAQNCTVGDYITDYMCLNIHGFKKALVIDSAASFPSMHTTVATFSSSFSAAFIEMRFQTNNKGVFLKPIFCALAFTWGLGVGITRIMDHRHHWWDVLFSFAFGIFTVLYTVIFYCDCFKDTANKTRTPVKRTCTTSICATNDEENLC